MAKASEIEIPSLLFDEQGAAPATPAAGFWRAYFKSDGLYVKDDAGAESGPLGVSGGGGAILQVVTATSTTEDVTNATTAQNSSLSAIITPQAADSKLIIEVDGECSANENAGSTNDRRVWVEIFNSTNSVSVKKEIRGRMLVSATVGGAGSYDAIALKGIYTVNSVVARTFRLRFHSQVAQVESRIGGNRTGGVIMTIIEVAA